MSQKVNDIYYADILQEYLSVKFSNNFNREVSESLDNTISLALNLGIDINFLKRRRLSRIQVVVNTLENYRPKNLLDIGAGKGYLLWPLLETNSKIRIMAVDIVPAVGKRLSQIAQATRFDLQTACCDGENLPLKSNSFGAVTMLQVLEHTGAPQRMINEACRVSKHLVLATVPSKPDTNPEHIHLFNKGLLESPAIISTNFSPKVLTT